MLRLIVVIALIFSATAAGAASKDCTTKMQNYALWVSAQTKPLPASAFKGINRRWSVERIIKHLGPAARDIGSGLHIFEWDISDGRVFSVSTGALCGKPMKIGYYPVPGKGLTQ
jgi:hypothetical protein